MNRRGFTLIELLAVIVILSGISLLVVSSINSTLERRDEKEYIEQIELAKNAAKIYFSLNDVNNVKIQDLINGDYLSSSKVGRLKKDSSIFIYNDGYKYCPSDFDNDYTKCQ